MVIAIVLSLPNNNDYVCMYDTRAGRAWIYISRSTSTAHDSVQCAVIILVVIDVSERRKVFLD